MIFDMTPQSISLCNFEHTTFEGSFCLIGLSLSPSDLNLEFLPDTLESKNLKSQKFD